MTAVPATLPAAEIVRRLNDIRPSVLLAHASTLAQLAAEQRAGRLRIAPRAITAMSELLSGQDRSAINDAFGVPPVDQFASTEGLARPVGPVPPT
jgi:phenylacetate-CoA ligase